MGETGDSIRVTVKWMGKQFDNLELSLDEPLHVFRVQLYSLTGVPPDRQKLMYKGLLSDGTDLRKTALCNGAKVMLVGSAEKLVERAEPVRFFEDMSPEEKSRLLGTAKIQRLPCGLMNLGNTCYFNAVFQFLQPVAELWKDIELLPPAKVAESASQHYQLAKSLLDMRTHLPMTSSRYVPLAQVQLLRQINPLFSRTDEKTGVYLQQDAEECLSTILSSIDSMADSKITNSLFGYMLSTTIRPKERPEGAAPVPADVQEGNIKLNCYMGTQLKSVGNVMDGIMLSLNEDVVKFSEELGCDVLHEKVARLSSLPKYLIVHLVRFEWKQESKVSKTEAVKAKVCRRVNFERELDITSTCTEELQTMLHAANAVAMRKDFALASASQAEPFRGYEMDPKEYATGKYELQSVVTHQGRTADGGHYICWTKDARERDQSPTEGPDASGKGCAEGDTWLMFDDDSVTEYRWGSFDLCGGRSDYHIAVLLLYKARCVRVEPESAAPDAEGVGP